ncbi:MAG: SDR family NAD(P)-dependent oxidoreductase [Anaerolineae bacterium]
MYNPTQLRKHTAIVTGVTGGIGRAIDVSLACHLALADINEAGLKTIADLIAPQGVQVTCHKLDVSDAQPVANFPARVRQPTAPPD